MSYSATPEWVNLSGSHAVDPGAGKRVSVLFVQPTGGDVTVKADATTIAVVVDGSVWPGNMPATLPTGAELVLEGTASVNLVYQVG